MLPSDVSWALDQLGRSATGGTLLTGSRSGAAVCRVTLADGDAVVKVVRRGGTVVSAARRELRVYSSLAQHLRVRTPRLLDAIESEEAVVLLLSAHPPSVPAADWDADRWQAAAADLALLHDHPVPDDPGWRRPSALLDRLAAPELAQALAFYTEPEEVDLVTSVLDRADLLLEAIAAPAAVLLHGDCHADNLLPEAGGLVWVDWPEAGVGCPAADLAFLSVRGVPDGAVLPYAAMLATYAAGRGVDASEIETAVVAIELAMLILVWPEYAGFNSVAAQDRVRWRVRQLAGGWLSGRARW